MAKIHEKLDSMIISKGSRSRFLVETICIVVVACVIFGFAQEYDAFEYLVEISRQHEDWELDEVFTLLMVGAVALAFINLRNAKYLKLEIKRRRKVEKKINKLAFFDSLTGLPNRDLCNNRLEHILVHAKRFNTLAAVLFIDLDHFKAINDTYGHDAVDEVLKQTASRLLSRLRKDDTLARISGDEFIVILESVTDPNNVSTLAEELLTTIQSPFIINGQEAHISLSVGIAIYPNDGEQPTVLMKNADTAMYHAKSEGKNTFRFFSNELDQQAKNKLKITNHLRQALQRQEFTLDYQPIIDPKTNKIKGAEALLRWDNPTLGKISPAVFIPIAEEIGMIIQIGDWVLLQACHQNKVWQLAGHQKLVMSVNMSAKQLADDNYISTVENCLKETALTANYLELELTETAIMKDINVGVKKVAQLKKLGVSIALDDFGTGYSSMSYLCKLKINRIKIDRSFIQNIPQNKDDIITVKAIISLAKNLDLMVTAEGVETQEQQAFIAATSTDSAQGFYYFRPMSADKFELLINKQRD